MSGMINKQREGDIKALATFCIAQTVTKFTYKTLKQAIISRSHVGLAGEVAISSFKNLALEEVDLFLNIFL